jgi:cytochrome c biogenesis protein CcdA
MKTITKVKRVIGWVIVSVLGFLFVFSMFRSLFDSWGEFFTASAYVLVVFSLTIIFFNFLWCLLGDGEGEE